MGWGVLGPTFDKNRPRATLQNAPLVTSMTPHKMFRRRLLDEHQIRFFEGPRRMEDHPFVLEAYFRADVISVLADRPIYYWNRRPDQGNAGARSFDWGEFYGFMRDTLDVIDRLAEPDELRDKLLAFYYDSKGLGSFSRSAISHPRAAVQQQFQALRSLAEERFPPAIDAQLKGVIRARSELLRAGDLDGIIALAQLENSIKPYVEMIELSLDEEARLRIHLKAGLHDATAPPGAGSGGGSVLLAPAPGPGLHFIGCHRPDCVLHRKRVEIALRSRKTSEVYLVAGTIQPPPESDEVPLVFDSTFVIDAEGAAFGRPLADGVYDVFVRLRVPPWRRQARLPSGPSADGADPRGHSPRYRAERGGPVHNARGKPRHRREPDTFLRPQSRIGLTANRTAGEGSGQLPARHPATRVAHSGSAADRVAPPGVGDRRHRGQGTLGDRGGQHGPSGGSCAAGVGVRR